MAPLDIVFVGLSLSSSWGNGHATTFRALLARVPQGQSIAMHFLKYEEASDDELDELIRSLRHLLGEDDNDGEK